MKAKLFLSLVAALLLQFSTVKADTYSDGLKNLIEFGVMSFGSNQELDAEMNQSLVEWLTPYYRKNMSETEFKQMCDYMTRADNAELLKKVYKSIGTDPSEMQSIISPDIAQKLMFGQTPDNLKLPECDPQLLKEVQRYMKMERTEEIGRSTVSAIKEILPKQMAGSIPEAQRGQVMNLLSSVFGYIEQNIGVILTTQMVKSLSLDDIKKLNAIENEPFFPAYQKVTDDVANNMKPLLDMMVQNISKRMNK